MSYREKRNPRKNAEGYADPTAYEALKRISKNEYSSDRIDKYVIARRQRLFPHGAKVRILKMHDESMSSYNQRICRVDFVDDLGYIFVTFRGSKKGLRLSGLDEFEKII